MSTTIKKSVNIPELKIYNARLREEIILKNVEVDTDYARDKENRVMYFNIEEAGAYLGERGKTLPSMALLVNLYIALDGLARQDEAAAQIMQQLNNNWDRTGTTISPEGRIVHRDMVLGEIAYEGLSVPEKGDGLDKLYQENELFFQALMGIRDIDRLVAVTNKYDKIPFYWYPRGERTVMFGGGDFYYMHQYIPGLLMLFCDDEAQSRRVIRGVGNGKRAERR
ncbi:MAG: hypothetical protein PHE50_01720 [Dehalococcoidales bacterium]|nr:hypothetical protein [Dehalococcoidales bacterium]